CKRSMSVAWQRGDRSIRTDQPAPMKIPERMIDLGHRFDVEPVEHMQDLGAMPLIVERKVQQDGAEGLRLPPGVREGVVDAVLIPDGDRQPLECVVGTIETGAKGGARP